MRVSIDGGSSGVSIGSTVTGGTAGSVLFVGTGPVLAQDNAHLFYDATNHTLLLNTASSPLQTESGSYPLFSYRGNAIGVAGFLGIGNVPLLEFYRANGTFGTPTTVSPGDVLGGLRFYGHDGNSYADSDPAVVLTAFVGPTVNAGSSIVTGGLDMTTQDSGGSGRLRYRMTSTGTTGVNASACTSNGSTHCLAGQVEIQGGPFLLPGATSGTLTLKPAAVAGTNTLTLPAGTTDFSATGGTSQVVKQISAGAAFTVARLACADLSDAASGCSSSGTSFANPTASAGGTVVNGSASTAMRSDGAPALAVVQTRRVCSLLLGADNGVALVDADLGPQGQQCKISAAATVQEIVVNSDTGTPNVIVRKKHCATFAAGVCTSWTSTDLLSSALAAAASNFDACSNTGGTTGLDGGTTCSGTLQNTALAIGDWIELKSGTAGGSAHRVSVDVTFTIN